MRQKTFDGKIWHSPHPLIQTFSIPENNERLKGSLKAFSAQWDKKFSKEIFILPLPLIHELLRYQNVSKTQHGRVPLRNVSVLWDEKNSTKSRGITLLSIKLFGSRIGDTLESSPTIFFGTVRRKISEEKLNTSPCFLSINLLATRNFWNTA